MKKRYFLLSLFIVLLLGFVSAFEYNGTNVTCEDLGEIENQILGAEVPSILPYKNEIFNVYFKNESLGNLHIEEGVITDFSCGKNENATYELKINNESLFENPDSNYSTIDFLNQKLDNKEIEVNGITFGKKIKWFFTTIAIKIMSLFG
ncbi:MAG: hypothetical protein Q8Q04_00175 [archaeon]|nr:hypothetical protein [archaeon]